MIGGSSKYSCFRLTEMKSRGHCIGMKGLYDEERRILNDAIIATIDGNPSMEEVWDEVLDYMSKGSDPETSILNQESRLSYIR